MMLLRNSRLLRLLHRDLDVTRSVPVAACQLHQAAQAQLSNHQPPTESSHHLRPLRQKMIIQSSSLALTANKKDLLQNYSQHQHRTFTSAYGGTPGDGKHNKQLVKQIIPYQSTLKDGRRVEIDFFHHSPTDIEEDEWFAGMALMNLIIREGRSWPFDEEFTSVDDWRGYFLSHTAFVVRALDNGMDAANRNSSSQGEILGCFYIKPNFPGRCSHVCNGGFITAPRFRGLGIGRLMGNVFLRAAKDLGYKSSYFNLVFKSNVSSVKLWESLGFQRVATLENAAALEGLEEGELDTAYGYRYDLTKLPEDHLESQN